MARNKQIGPEIKLYQIDTMIYLTTKNIVSKIEMFSKFLEWGGVDQAKSARINNARAVERFDKNYRISDIKDLNTIDGQANETWLRKSGFLVSTDSKYELSPIATAIIENKISIAEYCFLILSKQWVVIKKPGEPSEYKANLLALVLEILSNHGDIPAADFVTTINQDIVDKYIDEYNGLALSNQEASRFIIEPLLLSGILAAEDNVYRLSMKHIELIENYLLNYNKIKNPNELSCLEESYLNCFEYGVFDIIDADNETVYANLYPGLFKQTPPKVNAVDDSMARQQIYYGAPGTGKSHTVKIHTEGESVVRTTFHPDSDYSTFVGCYKPTTKEVEMRDVTGKVIIEHGQPVTENRIIYQFVDQAFLQAYIKAWKFYTETLEGADPKKQFLIIEEINRGNCAQIFGDLFQLLDRNDYGFSDYYIHADRDMQKHLAKAFNGIAMNDSHKNTINAMYHNGERDIVAQVLNGEILLLPNNLYIWATMNTSDQSLFPIDSAFKRRWDWKYKPITKGRDNDGSELNWRIKADTKEYDWWSFLVKINEIVWSTTNSEDKKLGFFFCKPTDGIISAETFVGKVIFYLWNDVFKDFGFDEDIFHDEKLEDGTYSTLNFNKFYTTTAAGETIVRKDKVEKFLDNLKVEEVIIDDSKSVGNFSLDGVAGMTLGEIAKEIVNRYAQNNLGKSAQEIRNIFVEQCKGIGVSHIVETEEEYHKRDGQASQERSASEITIPNGEKLYVTTQWRAKKDSDNFIRFIDIAGRNGWGTITPTR